LRAKSLSAERENKPDEPSLYTQFLSVLIHKVKEQKTMEEYLRRIFQQDAYIFFTLDKLMLGLVKLINNINADSLTFKILRDDVRDYDLEIRRWNDYTHPTVTEQLTRLYREREVLFRFSFTSVDKLLFISAW
jgi:histone deacetylase complex regulatory component SIN3